jgi:hypothetical protein
VLLAESKRKKNFFFEDTNIFAEVVSNMKYIFIFQVLWEICHNAGDEICSNFNSVSATILNTKKINACNLIDHKKASLPFIGA